MSFKHRVCSHLNCYFSEPGNAWKYNGEYLRDICFLRQLKRRGYFCSCWEFAWIRGNPDFENVELEEHEFIDMAYNAGFFYDCKETKYRYTLGRHSGMVFIDMNIGDLLKEFDPEIYRDNFEFTKTPKSGRMFYALLGYCYPQVSFRRNDHKFRIAYEMAMDTVFNQIEEYTPSSVQHVVDEMPKSTSAGFVAVRLFNARRKKEIILKEIIDEYYKMEKLVASNRKHEVENYIMFAMRGHLSKKTAIKTRPIWMQSAETIIMEARFARGLYKQFESNPWFKKRMIHGSGSMKHLRKYLYTNTHYHFVNTDISGWDAFRCVFLHCDFYDRLKQKINMGWRDNKLYDFMNRDSNIFGKVILPSGLVFKTQGGLKSGSEWTLAQNTLLNMIDCLTALYMMGYTDKELEDISWLGDDFSLKTPSEFNLQHFSHIMLKYFGLLVKPEKCFKSAPDKDRKFLGYEIRGGLLYKDLKELWPGILYTEHYFKRDYQSITKSFTRLFSYLVLGGVNNFKFMEFFFLFLGQYGSWLDKVKVIFDDQSFRMTRVLKDIYDVKIGKFDSNTFKKFSLIICKYILLYDYDFLQVEKFLV